VFSLRSKPLRRLANLLLPTPPTKWLCLSSLRPYAGPCCLHTALVLRRLVVFTVCTVRSLAVERFPSTDLDVVACFNDLLEQLHKHLDSAVPPSVSAPGGHKEAGGGANHRPGMRPSTADSFTGEIVRLSALEGRRAYVTVRSRPKDVGESKANHVYLHGSAESSPKSSPRPRSSWSAKPLSFRSSGPTTPYVAHSLMC